jgi:tetratricopeptide (TPR) repeat protein
MRKTTFWLAIAALAFVPAFAQQPTGKIHGHVQDPAGVTITDGIIGLSQDGGATSKITFNCDANGDYKGEAPQGTYTVVLKRPDTGAGKFLDKFDSVKIVGGADLTQDFDLSRAEYVAKLPPDVRKQLEEVKAKNAGVLKENVQIKNLNANLIKARDDNKNKNFAEAETLMLGATVAKPEAPVLWLELGMAQSGLKKWDDAAVSLKKAIDLDAAAKKPNPEIEGAAGNALGEVLATQSKVPDAQAAYEAAAKANPTAAGTYFANEAIVMQRVGQADAVIPAADKAIAADPTKPIPYYLKGQALINKATVDPKTQKIVAPPGCLEAYQKYLDLAPDGPFANEVKAVIGEMGGKVQTTFKAGKK